jgi:hypothetical protein
MFGKIDLLFFWSTFVDDHTDILMELGALMESTSVELVEGLGFENGKSDDFSRVISELE